MRLRGNRARTGHGLWRGRAPVDQVRSCLGQAVASAEEDEILLRLAPTMGDGSEEGGIEPTEARKDLGADVVVLAVGGGGQPHAPGIRHDDLEPSLVEDSADQPRARPDLEHDSHPSVPLSTGRHTIAVRERSRKPARSSGSRPTRVTPPLCRSPLRATSCQRCRSRWSRRERRWYAPAWLTSRPGSSPGVRAGMYLDAPRKLAVLNRP